MAHLVLEEWKTLLDRWQPAIEIVDRDLTIRGLLEIYQRNAVQRPA